MPRTFPPGFLWGAATASHQVEGGNHNDWSEWEEAHADELAHSAISRWGHIAGWRERFSREATQSDNYRTGAAADHWNRYEEDFDILKSLNLNAYRFSIEWSRIEPEEGKFDETAIEHYREMIRALQSRGIEPFVTLWHWSNPLWVRDQGDWSHPATVDRFARYAERMVHALPDVTYWIPVNEPNIHTMYAYVLGKQPPGKRNLFQAARVYFQILSGHRRAAKVIHAHIPHAKVGMANSTICFEPKNSLFFNRWLAAICQYVWNVFPFRYTREANDFFGINYYSRQLVGIGPKTASDTLPKSDLGWSIYPAGIGTVLRQLGAYQQPIYITENGLADADDSHRANFIHDHLAEIHTAITQGVDVRGYLHWSLLDNNEFVELRGFWPRFGLVAIDRATQVRTVRESARRYAEIARANALP